MSKVSYPCFWIGRDHRGEWRWMYYAPNGEEVAVASAGYFNRENCYRDIEIMKGCAEAAVFYTPDPAEAEAEAEAYAEAYAAASQHG
jgi:uncharacterized protein